MIEIVEVPGVHRSAHSTHARAVWSRRQRAHVSPLGLLVAALRAIAGEARNKRAKAHNEEVCERLRLSFDDYLVSDVLGVSESELRLIRWKREKIAEWDTALQAFSARRIRHLDRAGKRDRLTMTGRHPWSHDLADYDAELFSWPLDAPEYLAGGATRDNGFQIVAFRP